MDENVNPLSYAYVIGTPTKQIELISENLDDTSARLRRPVSCTYDEEINVKQDPDSNIFHKTLISNDSDIDIQHLESLIKSETLDDIPESILTPSVPVLDFPSPIKNAHFDDIEIEESHILDDLKREADDLDLNQHPHETNANLEITLINSEPANILAESEIVNSTNNLQECITASEKFYQQERVNNEGVVNSEECNKESVTNCEEHRIQSVTISIEHNKESFTNSEEHNIESVVSSEEHIKGSSTNSEEHNQQEHINNPKKGHKLEKNTKNKVSIKSQSFNKRNKKTVFNRGTTANNTKRKKGQIAPHFDNIYSNHSVTDLPLELVGTLTKRSVHFKKDIITSGENKDIDNMKNKKIVKVKKRAVKVTKRAAKVNKRTGEVKKKEAISGIIKTETKAAIDKNIVLPVVKRTLKSSVYAKKCKQCWVLYYSVETLVDHVFTCHPETFVCDVCGANFNLKSSVRNHMELHFNKQLIRCQDCEYTTLSRGAYYTHKKRHSDKKVFYCTQCTYSCEYRSRLKLHELCHFAKKMYKCSYCDYQTPYVAACDRHLICHTFEKPFKCKLCSFTSKFKYNLTLHERIHSQDTPYKCTLCKREFKWASALRAHMITHKAVNQKYFCNECPYSTARGPSMMHRHQLTHMNSISCTDCSYTTNRLKNLVCHRIKNHKVNKRYVCPFCKFTSKCLRTTLEHKSIHLKGCNRRKVNNALKNEDRKLIKSEEAFNN